MEKAKALRLIGKFCRVRVPLDVDPLQNPGEIPKILPRAGIQLKIRFDMPAEWQGCRGQAAGGALMGQLRSLGIHKKLDFPLDRAISVPAPVRPEFGLSFRAALYDSIKAKDCLCSGGLRDGGPGLAAITHSPLST